MADRILRAVALNRIVRADGASRILQPAPARTRIVVQPRGAPGRNAARDLVVNVPGPYGAGEVIFDMVCGAAQTFVQAHCKVRLRWPPAADWTVAIYVNGALWAAGQVAAGDNLGAVVLVGTAFAEDDLVEIIAPDPADDTAAGLTLTLAGA